jgi:hypothetical protein
MFELQALENFGPKYLQSLAELEKEWPKFITRSYLSNDVGHRLFLNLLFNFNGKTISWKKRSWHIFVHF